MSGERLPGRRRGWVAWLAGTAALVGLAAILVVVNRGAGPAEVAVVGDSVTYLSRDPLEESFTWARRVEVRGRSGFRTDQLVPTAEEVVDAGPAVLVLLTGYNDVLQEADPEAGLGQMVDVARRAPCTVWMEIPRKGVYDPARAEFYNARLAELTRPVSTIHVSPLWRDAVDATEGPDPHVDLVTSDRVHPTDTGSRTLARLMDEAVRDLCPRR